jgi:hypothetical protein
VGGEQSRGNPAFGQNTLMRTAEAAPR